MKLFLKRLVLTFGMLNLRLFLKFIVELFSDGSNLLSL